MTIVEILLLAAAALGATVLSLNASLSFFVNTAGATSWARLLAAFLAWVGVFVLVSWWVA